VGLASVPMVISSPLCPPQCAREVFDFVVDKDMPIKEIVYAPILPTPMGLNENILSKYLYQRLLDF